MVCAEVILNYFPLLIAHIVYDKIGSRRLMHYSRNLNHEIKERLMMVGGAGWGIAYANSCVEYVYTILYQCHYLIKSIATKHAIAKCSYY